MPSFRVQFDIADMRPGNRPDQVIPAARAAVPHPLHCDDARIDLPRGIPVVTVRYTIDPTSDDDEDRRAVAAGRQIAQTMDQIVKIAGMRVLRRRGNNWLPVIG